MATILGIFFWGQELNERGVMNINGALFIYLLNLSMQNAFAVVNVSGQKCFLLGFLNWSFN